LEKHGDRTDDNFLDSSQLDYSHPDGWLSFCNRRGGCQNLAEKTGEKLTGLGDHHGSHQLEDLHPPRQLAHSFLDGVHRWNRVALHLDSP
jgi:hypothetical protein